MRSFRLEFLRGPMKLRRSILACVMMAAALGKALSDDPLLPSGWSRALPLWVSELAGPFLAAAEAVVALLLLGRRWLAGLWMGGVLALFFLIWQIGQLLLSGHPVACGCFGSYQLGVVPHLMILAGFALVNLSCLVGAAAITSRNSSMPS